MVIRLLGSNYSVLETRSNNFLSYEPSIYMRLGFLRVWRISKIGLFKFTFIDFRSFWEGGPVQHRIFYNWLIVETPWNSGLPLMISAIMQPRLHISIYFEYE